MASLLIQAALPLLSLLIITHPAFAFPQNTISNQKRNFDNQNDLPTLGAVLQWTHDPTLSTLSMAFTAQPSTPDGWVAWALNPNKSGMVGAQALIAFRPNSTGPVIVDTYDIISYHDIIKGPISYNVTSLASEESNGTITIFATWTLPVGETTVNQTWQVGPVVDGKPGAHEMLPPNLSSKMKLNLVNVGPTNGPAVAPGGPMPANKSTGVPPSTPASGGAGKDLFLLKSFGVSMLLVLETLLVVSFF